MAIGPPKCYSRKCRHYLGIKQDNEDEQTERPVCKAFPDGIPAEIAYGSNDHLQPFPGDHGIQFQRRKK